MQFTSLIKSFIEIGFSLGLFVNAVLFIPQIVKLLKVKDSRGLSLLTFGGFSLIQLFVILHGFIVKDYLLLIGYLISLFTCGTLTLMIVYYKFKNGAQKAKE